MFNKIFIFYSKIIKYTDLAVTKISIGISIMQIILKVKLIIH